MAKRGKSVKSSRKRKNKRMKLSNSSLEELMFLAYSDDLRHQIDVQRKYDNYWRKDPTLIKVDRIFKILKSVTMGCCHGGVSGMNGSVRPTSLIKIVSALGHHGGMFFDFGCGYGLVLLVALAMGFNIATGCELPVNSAQRIGFEATKAAIAAYPAAYWLGQDILQLNLPLQTLEQISSAYAFWVGMPKPVQRCILDLCRSSFINIRSIAVFLDRKWPKPNNGNWPLVSS
jgi:SAM-dependent methyltransferase